MSIDKKESIDPCLRTVLSDFGGEEGIKIVQVLMSLGTNDEITDEKLAEMSVIKLNIVRKILYVLNENKLTSFKRLRDKKSGWFVYYWKATPENLPILLDERKKQVIDKLTTRLKFEEENLFFRCDKGCLKRHIFVDAMEVDFKCQCGGNLKEEDASRPAVKFLKEKIYALRNQ